MELKNNTILDISVLEEKLHKCHNSVTRAMSLLGDITPFSVSYDRMFADHQPQGSE